MCKQSEVKWTFTTWILERSQKQKHDSLIVLDISFRRQATHDLLQVSFYDKVPQVPEHVGFS